jgi:hypothetical protein
MKIGLPFLQLPLLFDASVLEAEVRAIGEAAWQPHPLGYAGNDAMLLIAKDGDANSDAVSGPMQPTPHLLRCPYLMQVLDSIGATWGRTRLMRLSGQAEVTAHVDVNYYWAERTRVHVPIVTQPTVRFICGGAEVNMRAGECWIFDTWTEHNVINDHALPRIHLVADTVGGPGFWDHVRGGRPHDRVVQGWEPRPCTPIAGYVPELDFEARNYPSVMSPWEVRQHFQFLLGEAKPHPNLPLIQQLMVTFGRRWQSLWARYGDDPEGLPRYRGAIEATRQDLTVCNAHQILLRNDVGLMEALNAWVFTPALPDRRSLLDAPAAPAPAAASAPRSTPVAIARTESDPVFERPVFIVGSPRSGSTLLFETLARAPGVYTIGDESHQVIEGMPQLGASAHNYESNRLLATDATPEIARQLRERFLAELHDRDQRPPVEGQRLRMLEKTPKNSLRVPLLAAVFPEARFIYLHRDPRQVLSSMMEAWSSGRFRTYPRLPGWTGLPWSLLLVPGWRDLIGKSLHTIVAAQWRTMTRLLLDDLEQLPADRWTVARYDTLVSNPQAEITRICAATSLEWDDTSLASLPLSKYTLSSPDPEKWKRLTALIEAVWPSIQDQVQRVEALAVRR